MEVTNLTELDQFRVRRTKWRAALTSGNYKQGYGRLHYFHDYYASGDERFCCLGVACEVFGPEEKINQAYDGYFDEVDGTSSTQLLPERLRLYLGLSRENQSILTTLNDSGQADFHVIAAAIGAMGFHKEA